MHCYFITSSYNIVLFNNLTQCNTFIAHIIILYCIHYHHHHHRYNKKEH